MGRIITISREFGSGGRELGKRLTDVLGWDYYDKEIISSIAERHGLDEQYVENMLNHGGWHAFPIAYRHSFIAPSVISASRSEIFVEQKKVIEEIAKTGNDCVIVGRNADVLLKDYKPFNIFVCADIEAKIARCQRYAGEGENLTDKEIRKNILQIDKNRARAREMFTGSKWGERSAYDLIVNTTNWTIKELAPVVAEFALKWFEQK